MTSLARDEIDGDAVEAFQRDGYTIFRDVIDAALIKENWQREKMLDLGPPDFGPVQNNISFNAAAGSSDYVFDGTKTPHAEGEEFSPLSV
jgi:hypothetical protein